MTYHLSNLDTYNALEIGSLSVPLVFQVHSSASSLQMPVTSITMCGIADGIYGTHHAHTLHAWLLWRFPSTAAVTAFICAAVIQLANRLRCMLSAASSLGVEC